VTIGLVSGTVAAAHKSPALQGITLLAVQELDLALTPTGIGLVVADTVGAGRGDLVLIAHGIAALHTDATAQRPVDAAVIAIIDKIELD
jgi:microcompartment protein CcmK/EutM